MITDFYRTQKRQEPIEDESSTIISAEEEVLRHQLGGRLGEAISGLTDRQREVIRMRFLDGLEYPEIAERLGCGAGAVRVTQMRALRALRKSLDDGRGAGLLTHALADRSPTPAWHRTSLLAG